MGVVCKAREVGVVAERWLELGNEVNFGAVADYGARVVPDESIQVKALGFQVQQLLLSI